MRSGLILITILSIQNFILKYHPPTLYEIDETYMIYNILLIRPVARLCLAELITAISDKLPYQNYQIKFSVRLFDKLYSYHS